MLFELLLAGTVALVIWLLFFKKDDNPLDKLPGPPQKPIIGNAWELFRTPPEKLLDFLVDCTKKYGDRFILNLLGHRVLHISAPADIEVVLSNTKNIQKSIPYRFLKDWLGSGLLLSTGAHWHKRRKILTPTFHFNILKNFATIIEENGQEMVKMLKEKNGEEVNLFPMLSDFTLRIICAPCSGHYLFLEYVNKHQFIPTETAMGTKLDKNQTSASLDYKTAVTDIGMTMLGRITKIWLQNDFVFNNTSTGKSFAKTLHIARSFADNVIKERKAQRAQNKTSVEEVSDEIGTKKRMAMLDFLLEAEEKGEIDIQGIRDEVNTFMFAGHDTTAVAMTFVLMQLADYEDVQERIYEECMSIMGDSDRAPSLSDLASMKYLEAVIKESMRLYPSVPFVGREVNEDFKLGDLLVKKGTTVDLHFYELHRREDLFPDPEIFKPERFLQGEMKHPYAYLPFSAGPRNCIGQRFAMQEMKCTLSEIFRNFKVVPKVKGARPALLADLVLRPLDPIYVKFVPR